MESQAVVPHSDVSQDISPSLHHGFQNGEGLGRLEGPKSPRLMRAMPPSNPSNPSGRGLMIEIPLIGVF